MSYIGIEPSYGAFEKQLLTGDGTTSTFTLDYPVGQPGQLLVSLDGIVQEPEYAFSISLSSGSPKINFADAPANGARIFIVYLGRQLLVATTANSSPVFDQFSGNGSTRTFALSETPVTNTAENFIVFVDNVYQRLGSGLAYTISGSNIVFSSAPPSGTNNIQVTQLARSNTLITVADGSISLTKLSFDPADDDFYSEVDTRLQQPFPTKFKQTQQVRQKDTSSPSQVFAGTSRTPASKKIKLTQEDVRLANKWNVPLEQYAKEKAKVSDSEEYTTISTMSRSS